MGHKLLGRGEYCKQCKYYIVDMSYFRYGNLYSLGKLFNDIIRSWCLFRTEIPDPSKVRMATSDSVLRSPSLLPSRKYKNKVDIFSWMLSENFDTFTLVAGRKIHCLTHNVSGKWWEVIITGMCLCLPKRLPLSILPQSLGLGPNPRFPVNLMLYDGIILWCCIPMMEYTYDAV